MHKLFKQFGVYREEQGLSPLLGDHIFQDYPTLAELQQHWGVAGHLVPTSRAIPLDVNITREEEECNWERVTVPAGEEYSLGVYIGGGVVTKGIFYAIEAGNFTGSGRIELFDVAADAVVAGSVVTIADFSLATNGYLATSQYVALESPLVFRVVFDADSLPATDADGNFKFFDECNPVPCLRMTTHLLIDDTCYVPTFHGGKKSPCDGFEEPPFTCPPATAAAPVIADGASGGSAGTTVNIAALTNTGGAVVTWSAAGLPAGLTIDATTGVVSGTVGLGGFNGTAVITATNAAGSDTGNLVLSYTAI